MSNGDRTTANDTSLQQLLRPVDKEKPIGEEHRIKEGSVIKYVVIMFHSFDSRLMGIKFLDEHKNQLLQAGPINLTNYESDNKICVQTIALITNEGERLLGIKSGQRGDTWAEHYDL